MCDWIKHLFLLCNTLAARLLLCNTLAVHLLLCNTPAGVKFTFAHVLSPVQEAPEGLVGHRWGAEGYHVDIDT